MSIYEAWDMGTRDSEEASECAPKENCPAHDVKIWIAGDLSAIHTICRFFCTDKCCVTITPTTFIYTGGQEVGACIGIMNYARFPEEAKTLEAKAFDLANRLMNFCCQKSCSVVTPSKSYYLKNPQMETAR